jgi:hypothetical protein
MNYVRRSPLVAGDWKVNIPYDFDGFPLSDVAYSERSLTRIQSSDNKREVRDGLGVLRKKYAIANNNMAWRYLQKYYNLFMVAKGRLIPFTFEDSLVRLDSDVFNASMLSYNVWDVDGLSMIQVLNNGSSEIKTWTHCINVIQADYPTLEYDDLGATNVIQLSSGSFDAIKDKHQCFVNGLQCQPNTVILQETLNSNSLTFVRQEVTFGVGGGRTPMPTEIGNLSPSITYNATGGIDGGRWAEIAIQFGGDDDTIQYGVSTIYMTNLSYTPSSPDEIITITFEAAIKNIAQSQSYPGLALICVIKQGANYYGASVLSVSNPAVGGDWVTYSGSFNLSSLGVDVIPGIPLEFGIDRAAFGDLPPGGAGTFSQTIGVDNLEYTVDIACP